MTESHEDHNSSHLTDKSRRICFSQIEFPSDTLSIKRLRAVFPNRFDSGVGNLTDGYDNFFFPLDHERPSQLVQLGVLISQERVLAEYAFYNSIDPYPSETLDDECRWCADKARAELEQLYQDFKLADSPETARLLTRHVEEQGERLGAGARNRTR